MQNLGHEAGCPEGRRMDTYIELPDVPMPSFDIAAPVLVLCNAD